MEFEPLKNKQNILRPLNPSSSCGYVPLKTKTSDDIHEEFKKISWFAGVIETPAGPVPQVSTVLSFSERMDHIRARTSGFRMKFSLKPGLYAVGNPATSSDIFVSANYRLSFDHLRRAIAGMDAWILVIDTAGINVWCAAGKGAFGTEELVKWIKTTGIEKCVDHRRIILPQLSAPGINSGDVRRITGFRISYGPVRADDIKKYISNGYKADEQMRLVRFNIIDRAVLVPIEINAIKWRFLNFILAALLYSALQPEGIIFRESITTGFPIIIAGITSILAGTVLTPILLPFIPFRSFAIKGGITGAFLLIIIEYFTGLFSSGSEYLFAAILILFTLISSYLALQFTGATTFTSLSGVKREIKYSLPIYITGFFVSTVLLILSKIIEWGYL